MNQLDQAIAENQIHVKKYSDNIDKLINLRDTIGTDAGPKKFLPQAIALASINRLDLRTALAELRSSSERILARRNLVERIPARINNITIPAILRHRRAVKAALDHLLDLRSKLDSLDPSQALLELDHDYFDGLFLSKQVRALGKDFLAEKIASQPSTNQGLQQTVLPSPAPQPIEPAATVAMPESPPAPLVVRQLNPDLSGDQLRELPIVKIFAAQLLPTTTRDNQALLATLHVRHTGLLATVNDSSLTPQVKRAAIAAHKEAVSTCITESADLAEGIRHFVTYFGSLYRDPVGLALLQGLDPTDLIDFANPSCYLGWLLVISKNKLGFKAMLNGLDKMIDGNLQEKDFSRLFSALEELSKKKGKNSGNIVELLARTLIGRAESKAATDGESIDTSDEDSPDIAEAEFDNMYTVFPNLDDTSMAVLRALQNHDMRLYKDLVLSVLRAKEAVANGARRRRVDKHGSPKFQPIPVSSLKGIWGGNATRLRGDLISLLESAGFSNENAQLTSQKLLKNVDAALLLLNGSASLVPVPAEIHGLVRSKLDEVLVKDDEVGEDEVGEDEEGEDDEDDDGEELEGDEDDDGEELEEDEEEEEDDDDY